MAFKIPQDPSDLAGGESGFYSYPIDNAGEYKGRIVFSVLEEPETDLDAALGKTGRLADGAAETLFGDNPADLEDSVQAFMGFDRPDARGNPLAEYRVLRQVSLYLPVGASFRDAINYDNADLARTGAASETAFQQGGNTIATLIEGGSKTLASAVTGPSGSDTAKLGTSRLLSALPDELQTAFRSTAGVTLNPNTRALFNSVALREFSFSFKLIAASAREAEEIKNIVRVFRTEAYPRNISVEVGSSEISIGYSFPNKWQIELEYADEEIATRIKPSFLRSVDVVYNSSGAAMHRDGNFAEVELNLFFQESRTLSREDIEAGY